MPPTLNSVGDYSHGVGGGSLNLNNVALLTGGNIGWIDDDLIAFASGVDTLPVDEWLASTYRVSTGVTARLNPATPSGANSGFAGGGHAAWWWASSTSPYRGLNSTTGFRSTAAGLLGMGPDAEIGYKPNYSALGPSQVRELSGSVWTLTPNHAYDLRLLGKRRAIFIDSVSGLQVVGIPTPVLLPGSVGFPCPFPINGVWWLGYWSSTAGLVAHPFAATTPLYTFVAVGIDAWPSFRALTNNSFRVVWSSTLAEQAGHMTAVTQIVSGVPAGPILDPPPGAGWGGPEPPPGGEPPPPGTGLPTTARAAVAPRPRVRRQYPHVDAITDWRAQQTTRLLWDRVFDLEERLQASEQTAIDLVPISNAQDETLAALQAVAGEALAIAQRTAGQAGGGAPVTGPGSIAEPIVAMSADYAQIQADVHASYLVLQPQAVAEGVGAAVGDEAHWVVYAQSPAQFSDHKWYLGWNRYWEDRMDSHNPGFPSSADPAGGSLPAIHT